jgi:hypothetical protein
MNRLTTPKSSSNGHSAASYLEHQIESTRNGIDVILTQIADRLDPMSLFADLRGLFVDRQDTFDPGEIRDAVSHSLRKAGQMAKEHPVPVVLSCLTIASFFLPKRNLQRSTEDAFEEVAEEAVRAKRKLGRKVKETGESIREAASAGKEALADRTSSMRHSLADLTESGKDKVGRIASEVESKTEDYPIGVAAGALALGFLAALALPGTRREKSVMGNSADKTVSRLKATSADLADEAKSLLHENDLDPDGLRKRASSLIQRTSRKARGLVEDHLEP